MMRLSHIAIASAQIDTILRQLKVLSLKVSEMHEVPTEKVRAAMIPVEISDDFRIEILEPTGDTSPIARFLEKRPHGGLHHLCFEVEDLDRWPVVLKEAGLEILPPGIRPGARGRALFLHPKSMGGVLVELEQIHRRS